MSLVDALDAPAIPGMGLLIVPTHDEGDIRHEWDKSKPETVEIARDVFTKYKAKGYKTYRVDPKSGDKGELLKEFDPNAEKLVMVPAFVGG